MDIPRCDAALHEALKEPRPKKLVDAINAFLKQTKKNADDPTSLEFICLDCKSEGVEGKARAFFASPPVRSSITMQLAMVKSDMPPSPQAIVLCANRLNTTEDVKEVVVHELIHAYDYTVRNMDLTQPAVLACSEVRSARESECYEKAQALCKNPQLTVLLQGCEWWVKKCVKQNAVLATSSLFPNDAEKHVDKVFDACFNDHSPFHK
ncbi:hypothetical protein H310_05898 [Aphanomyces invadans]|uniref:Mitochondrial inner membrane protease ATP23 n=1 Tax=Aphanomyces invadans TaxID=157072 RepID=A0A024U9U2_9STRA|nr:hypothetical protein H310_05898 [Aphanomyces invadans]ETW02368.1 hypothetical protein H310_05898 [Aphanomyces invadans]|eukprot:XP_008868973.1 hypothetical protein H310_05898 [Aphanomyces invadans]